MDKKNKALIVYTVAIIVSIAVILGSGFLNLFITPFSGGDKYTPWETTELKFILPRDAYELTGPKDYDMV